MDRIFVRPGGLPAAEDILGIQREGMREIARLAQGITGGAPVADGLECGPTQPGSMAVNLTGGTLWWPSVMDATAFGVLPPDLSGAMKLGGYAGATIPLSAPGGVGVEIVYLLEATYSEPDTDLQVDDYYDAADPAHPFSGPNNSGAQEFKRRVGRCSIVIKGSAIAPVGQAQQPGVDPGYVGLWLVRVPSGATAITSGMITPCPGAPRFTTRLVGGVGAGDLAAEAATRAAADTALNNALTLDVANLLAAIAAEATARNNADVAEAAARAAIRPGTSVMATLNASTTFVVPAGITHLKATVTGAGGGGGAAGTSTSGGGGGAGGTAVGYFDVAPGQSIAVTVGTSGLGGIVGGPGGPGGSTSFGGFISAGGGGGGDGGNGTSAGGPPGSGYGGQLTLVGGLGGDGSNSSLGKGGDGGASYWGGGGRAATGGGTSPQLGEAYGSGGGAGYYTANTSGGPGQIGVCVIEY